MSLKDILRNVTGAPSSEQVSSNLAGEQPLKSSPQRGGEFADRRRETSPDRFVFPQEYETKHVIVSDSETIQSITNQKQLQGNKYAPSSKSKISVLPQGVDMGSNSSPQRGEEAGLSELKRTLGVQVRGKINSHFEEQHLQSDANISRYIERKRKYPVINTKELSCKNANYIEINKKLDCFAYIYNGRKTTKKR